MDTLHSEFTTARGDVPKTLAEIVRLGRMDCDVA